MPPAGCHSKSFCPAPIFLTRRATPHPRARQPVDATELHMDPTNIALGLILIALIVLIPAGCIMTRQKSDKPQL
jgi:hypothetical protein